MSEFKATRKKTILDAVPRLSAEKLRDGTQRPNLSVYFSGNGIVFDVYTNLPSDKDNGRIKAELTPDQFYVFMKSMSNAIAGEAGFVEGIELKDYVWKGPKGNRTRSQEKLPRARLLAGKSDKGLVFISLLAYDQDRPKIRFFFDPSFSANLIRNGQPLNQDEVSVLYASGWADTLTRLAAQVLATEYKEPERKDNGNGQGGNQGGGYQNRNGGGQGGQGGGYQNRQQQQRPATNSNVDEFDEPPAANQTSGGGDTWEDNDPY